MNRLFAIQRIRQQLRSGATSIGSWMQIPHASIAEIMGRAGFDWVALDLEHGAIAVDGLPDLCRALELGDTLPMVRLAQGQPKDCKQALDSGAGGVIVPMVESAGQLQAIRDACCWPPSGTRGVGFSRANMFGVDFDAYREEAQAPLFVAMIENRRAIDNLDAILKVQGLDAILIGPYDLSASLGVTAQFEHPSFVQTLQTITVACRKHGIPYGIHAVAADPAELQRRADEGYRFIAYSIDAVLLHTAARRPTLREG